MLLSDSDCQGRSPHVVDRCKDVVVIGSERFHRSLQEEELWTAEYGSVDQARASIGRWIQEYNHDQPHRGVRNRTPHEAFLAFAALSKDEALTV